MNILVLDDEKEIADLVEVYLKNENYNVFKFYDSKEAIKCIENQKLDFAILDVMEKEEDVKKAIEKLTDQMLEYAANMEFEKAAETRDKIKELEKLCQ